MKMPSYKILRPVKNHVKKKLVNRGDNIEEVTICDRLAHRNIEMFQQQL